MTIYVPGEAAALLLGTPIHGSVDDVHAAGRFVQSIAEDALASGAHARRAHHSLAVMRSTAVSKLAASLTEGFVPLANVIYQSAITAKQALESYAAEVERMHDDASRVTTDVEHCLAVIRGQSARITEIARTVDLPATYVWNVGPPGIMPELRGLTEHDGEAARLWALHEAEWQRSASRWQRALAEIELARGRWERLLADRRRVEGQLVATLRATAPGRLAHVSGRGRAGVGDVSRAAMSAALQRSRAVPGVVGRSEFRAILSGGLTPAQVAENWALLALTRGDVRSFPLASLVTLAHTNGLPAWARDEASRVLLDYALDEPHEAFRLLGFMGGQEEIVRFIRDTRALSSALMSAERDASILPRGTEVQLVDFGNLSGTVTATISLGDLDRASNVGVNVSGMFSNVGGISNGVRGAHALFEAAVKADAGATYAVVTWVGYESPHLVSVLNIEHAEAGSRELANFLDGMSASRVVEGYVLNEFAVFAHSYGSTVAVEALQQTEFAIDTLITYGSAGIRPGTPLQELNASSLYATEADGDGMASIGRAGSSRTDPRKMPGAVTFTAELSEHGQATTSHEMYAEDGAWSLWNPGGTVGYLSKNTSSVNQMGKLLAKGEL